MFEKGECYLTEVKSENLEPCLKFRCSTCKVRFSAMGAEGFFKEYQDTERSMHLIYRASVRIMHAYACLLHHASIAKLLD